MSSVTQTVNQLLSFFTLLGGVLFITGVLLTRNNVSMRKFLIKYSLVLAFSVSLIATLGSLFYSEIARFEPCKLCWYQRIFLFPQTILFAVALWKKLPVAAYSLALSGIGALIAAYHTALQFGITSGLPCAKEAVSCTQRFVLEYGYITIPTMSLTAFLLLILFALFARLAKQ